MNAKKILSGLAVLFALTMQGISGTTIGKSLHVFSTPGPDFYADGTRVADGETYYLIQKKTSDSGWGVDTRGNVTGDAVLKWKQTARNAACPRFFLETSVTGQQLFLVLLDTRDANGVPNISNGVFAVSLAVSETTASPLVALSSATSTATTDQPVSLATGAKFAPPVITEFSFGNEGAHISAKTDDIGGYSLQESVDMTTWTTVRANLRSHMLRSAVDISGGSTAPVKFYRIISNLKTTP